MGEGSTALICGVSGQDGAYLAALLLDRGYRVVGTSRDAQINGFANLEHLKIRERVTTRSMSLTDFRSTLTVLADIDPDEIYNLAGQTSVGLSFEQPVETLESISVGTLNLLEAVRFLGKPIRLYNAGSSECFGDTGDAPADENTALRPRSPYAVAKAASVWQVANYREAYGLFACSGMLFNHDSPLRPERFVTQKVIRGACRIAAGSDEKLVLGDLDIVRDWGWAPDYVDAMHRMIQRDEAEDLVIATGRSQSLRAFVEAAFGSLDLDWRDHVESDPGLHRPTDLRVSRGNPSRAEQVIGWRASATMSDVVERMIAAERARS